MTHTVSGQTYAHRDTLKSMGGQWDATAKLWHFDRLSLTQTARLRALPGVFVKEPQSAPPVEHSRSDDHKQRELEKALENLFSRKSDDNIKPLHGDSTGMYGDCDRFYNCFKDQNPTAFFGFTSLTALTDYVAALDSPGRGRDEGWKDDNPKWSGTANMPEALALARDGWREGLDGLVDLDIPHAQTKRRERALAGGAVNVGRMLSGDPLHMVKRSKQPGRRVVTFFVETFVSSAIDADNAITRARLVAAMVDQMERRGYSCEIVAVLTTRNLEKIGHHATVTLKSAGERLNLLDIIFALGHPSFFRRLLFACVGASEHCRTTWRSQGSPATAFDKTHPVAKNEFYVRQLRLADQNKVDINDPLSMLPLIKPHGLEL